MKTSPRQISENGEDEYLSSLEAFRASLSVSPGSEEARKMTATSGRTCTAALTKSSPIGSLVKTLLESSRWLSKVTFMKWQVRQLYSERKIAFTDTNTEEPLPWNESAVTSKPTDMKSHRYLFQLAPLGLPTDETECSSLGDELMPTPLAVEVHHKARTQRALDKGQKSFRGRQDEGSDTHPSGIMDYLQFKGKLLNTPTSVQTSESPESLRARMDAHGWKNGTKYGSLQSQILYDPEARKMLGLLPTPTAIEGYKYTNTWNPNSQMGQSLSAMAGSGMLPTPRVSGQEGYESRAKRKGHECAMSYLETAVDYVAHQTQSVPDGESSRLSPLFTEEMMGFPLMWTTLPFLSRNGETSQSKPTEMR
jgi:hypothetical protein